MKRLLGLLLLASCTLQNTPIKPQICYYPQEKTLSSLSHPFLPLTKEELKTPWGQEIAIGMFFGQEMDLYRSIGAFKRAKVLISHEPYRMQQIDYSLILAYYLGGKYQEAISIFEEGACKEVDNKFPGLDTLLVVLYDSYTKTGQIEKASCILDIIHSLAPDKAVRLQTGTAIEVASFEAIRNIKREACFDASIQEFLDSYDRMKKNPKKAKILNAVLPGAGYYYLDQPKTAATALIVNGLFVAATWQLFRHGYVAPALFTLSLECGWYFGGINGAGLGAKEYNEALYNILGKEVMLKERLFPILEVNYAF